MLINAVVRRASGSRSTVSKAGRKNGSNRRSKWSRSVEVSATKFRNFEPVLAGGNGRLVLELTVEIVPTDCAPIYLSRKSAQRARGVLTRRAVAVMLVSRSHKFQPKITERFATRPGGLTRPHETGQ